jgi:hypothetical protein
MVTTIFIFADCQTARGDKYFKMDFKETGYEGVD